MRRPEDDVLHDEDGLRVAEPPEGGVGGRVGAADPARHAEGAHLVAGLERCHGRLHDLRKNRLDISQYNI